MLTVLYSPVGDVYLDHRSASPSPVLDPLQVGRVIRTISFDPHNDQMRLVSLSPFSNK